MSDFTKDNLPNFQIWLRTQLVRCPKCRGEFHFPSVQVRFIEEDNGMYGNPFRFYCGTSKCGSIFLIDPSELNNRYKQYCRKVHRIIAGKPNTITLNH